MADRDPRGDARPQQRLREPRAPVVHDGAGRRRAPAQRGQPQLGAGQRRPRDRPGDCRDPHRDRGGWSLLPGQRRQLHPGRADADLDGPHPARDSGAHPARPRPAARGPALRPLHSHAGRAAGDDGGRGMPDLRVPGVAAGHGRPRPERGRHRVRLHDRRHGRGRRGRRPVRRRPRQDRSAAAGRVRARLRHCPGAGDARPQPAARTARARHRRRWQHRLHVDGQLHAPAQLRAGDARSRDVAVVRRLPGLDADRRPGGRRDDGGTRPARRARPRGDGGAARRARRGVRAPLPHAPAVGSRGRRGPR